MIRASFYIYHFSSVIDFSSKRYTVSTGHRYFWYQQRRYSKDAKREARTRNSQWEQNFFPVVRRYLLIIFLSAITRILEGEETLRKSTLPQDNYWKRPVACEVVCCPYLPVRLQSQIIDDYGIISFNSVIFPPPIPPPHYPLTPGKLKKNPIPGIQFKKHFWDQL